MHAKSYRWTVLAVYTVLAGVSQMLWLNFAPLITQVQKMYGVNEFMASSLVLVFPLLYLLLSLHSGSLIDRRGYKFTIGVGGVITLIFSCLRIYTGSFWVLLLAQTGIAIGQPYIMNGISKLVADWFDRCETGMATGLGTVGMFLGMAVGMAVTPLLVSNMGMQKTMLVFALITAVSVAAFLVFSRENEPAAQKAAGEGILLDSWALFKIKDLAILFAMSFLGLGFFNGLTTWLEPILAPNGISAEKAGLIGAFLIFGGIAGSAIIPTLSDKFGRRKHFTMFCFFATLLFVYPLCTDAHLTRLIIFSGLVGFFLLPGYALMLAMTEEISGAERAGMTTGILMLAGNAGAVVVVIAMEMVKGGAATWKNAVFLMMGLLLAGFVLSGYLSEGSRCEGTEVSIESVDALPAGD
jgi:predicted MFS family arabinose efflux permease